MPDAISRTSMSNPYYDYAAVRDPDMFFGREDDLRELFEASEKRQCISIVGPRRSGKSSILKYMSLEGVQRRFGYDLHDRIFVPIDMHDYLNKSYDDFFESVCEEIFAQGRQKVPSLSRSVRKGEDQFRKLLEDLDREGFHVVMLMDSFDKVMANVQLDPNFFSFLRAQATRGWVSYITASIKPLYEVCHPKIVTSPFFDIFQTCNLGPLTLPEAQELINVPSTRAGHPFIQSEIQWILEQAGRHPFFLQITCRYLFEEKSKQNHQSNKEVDFELVRERAYQLLKPIFDVIWNDLGSDHQKELKRETQLHTDRLRKIPELSESWLFRKYIRESFQVDIPELTLKDIKDALDNLDDSSFLQDCKLSETHYIFVRDKGNSGSNTRKGWLVHEMLKLAFENMKPSGMRSDSAIEWRLYNILYYHYFKYHLANEKTAARLGVGSRRQFYREQERAIQALLKELLELEASSLNESHGHTY